MATIYCDDGGSNTSPYDTWAKAATTLATAITAATPGTDVIYVGHDHQEISSSADLRFTGPTSLPSQVIVRVNRTSGLYDTTDSTYNFVTTTGSYEVDFDGSFALYGIRIHSNERLALHAAADEWFYAQDCHFRIGDNDYIDLLSGRFCDCTFDAQDDTSRSAAMFVSSSEGLVEIIGGTVTGAASTDVLSDCAGTVRFSSVDMTGLASGTALALDGRALVEITKCRLPANYVLYGSGFQDNEAANQISIYESDTDAGNKKYNVQSANIFGDLSTETTIIRSGGFVDKSSNQGCSWEVVTTADAGADHPFCTPWMFKKVSSTDTTAKVHINHDNQGSGTGSALQDDEIWLEVEFLGASGNTGGTMASGKLANPLATASDHSTNSESWGASAKDDKQELSVTISPAVDCMARARVCVGKPSITVYVDPVLELS